MWPDRFGVSYLSGIVARAAQYLIAARFGLGAHLSPKRDDGRDRAGSPQCLVVIARISDFAGFLNLVMCV